MTDIYQDVSSISYFDYGDGIEMVMIKNLKIFEVKKKSN